MLLRTSAKESFKKFWNKNFLVRFLVYYVKILINYYLIKKLVLNNSSSTVKTNKNVLKMDVSENVCDGEH